MKLIKKIASICIIIVPLSLINIEISLAKSDYPIKPVSIIIPWPPGGGSDTTGRIFVHVAKKYFPKPFIIVNHPGAAGVRGTSEVSKSRPDGYTLGWCSSGDLVNNPHLMHTDYTLDSFTVLCSVEGSWGVLFTAGPWSTLEQLLEYAKKNPGKIRVGSAGMGSNLRLMGTQLMMEAGVQFTEVFFKGSAPVMTAVLGKHIEVGIVYPHQIMALYKAGKLKMLCLFRDKRLEMIQDVPTAKEKGFNVTKGTMKFIVAPKGVPQPIREKLGEALRKTLQGPEFQERLHAIGGTTSYLDSESATAFLKDWDKLTAELFKKLGLKKK